MTHNYGYDRFSMHVAEYHWSIARKEVWAEGVKPPPYRPQPWNVYPAHQVDWSKE